MCRASQVLTLFLSRLPKDVREERIVPMQVLTPPPEALEIAPDRHVMVQSCEAGNRPPAALYDAGAFGIYADGTWVAEAMTERGLPTVSYTRAGLYGSDPVPAGERPDPFFHASDMARLLDSLGMSSPVLLLGHSMAGLRLRAFATLFPERVRGLIFIDAVTPSQLGWTVRRELVRTGCRLISVCGGAAESQFGQKVLRLYPNNIRLEGRARADKLASLASTSHLAATRAEMLASTDPALKPRFGALPDVPKGAVTATIVARGTRDEPFRHLHIPRTGHAEILQPAPAARIADFALEVLGEGAGQAAATSLAFQG